MRANLSSVSAIALGLYEALLINQDYWENLYEQWDRAEPYKVRVVDEGGRPVDGPWSFEVMADAYTRADNTMLCPGEFVEIVDQTIGDQVIYARQWDKADEIRHAHQVRRALTRQACPWEINRWLKGGIM